MKTTLGPIGNDIYPPDGKNNENLKTFKNYLVCYTLNIKPAIYSELFGSNSFHLVIRLFITTAKKKSTHT